MCRAIALFWVGCALGCLLHGGPLDLFGLCLVMTFLADAVGELTALRRPY